MEPKEIKKHISKDTDVPTLLRMLAKTNIERSLEVLLELLEHKDQVRMALFAAKSIEYLDTEHVGAECIALVERWLKGEKVTKKQLKEAARTAYAASWAAKTAYAAASAARAAKAAKAAAYATCGRAAAYADWAARGAMAVRAAKYQEILEYGIGLLK
jgi:hypothetical protein